jgi:hypothetical protein
MPINVTTATNSNSEKPFFRNRVFIHKPLVVINRATPLIGTAPPSGAVIFASV